MERGEKKQCQLILFSQINFRTSINIFSADLLQDKIDVFVAFVYNFTKKSLHKK